MIRLIYLEKGITGFYSGFYSYSTFIQFNLGLEAKLLQSFLNSAHFMLFYEEF